MGPRNVMLTDETIAPSRRSAVLMTIAVALAVVLALNVGAGRLLRARPQNRGYWLIASKWQKLEALAEPVDWLFLGDSSCNQGIRPDVWRELGAGTSVNLCTIGDMLALNDAWMLERYLERHGPPRGGVIVTHAYDVWRRGASSALRGPLLAQIPRPWGFWTSAQPSLPLTREEALTVASVRYAPLYSEHRALASFLQPWRGGPAPRFALDENGYMRFDEASPSRVAKDVRGHLGFVRKQKPRLSSENRAALGRMRELAETRGFSLYVSTSPIVETLARDTEWRRHFEGVSRSLSDALKGSERARAVLTTPVTFPPNAMENADHLTHDAAGTFTRRLAESVGLSPAREDQSPAADPGSPNAAATSDATTEANTAASKATMASASAPTPSSGCPDGMVLVMGGYCPLVSQPCVEQPAVVGGEGQMQCQRFGEAKCLSPERRPLRFCMDRYEWPNEKGALPRTLTSWLEARTFCEEKGKRLCTEDEFNFACEGESLTAYVYGNARDATACNFDRPYIERTFTYTRWDTCMVDPACKAEFDRLDQRVPAGSMPRCVSWSGVFDLNGNVNEWVMRTDPNATSRSGLKGGWWGPVRDRCRPMTTFHLAGDFGYEAGFRCCKDAE